MLPKHTRSRASSRGRNTLYAMGAAALAVPLAFSSSVTAFAQTTAPEPLPAPPAEAISAITSGNLLPDFQKEYLSQVVKENIWNTDVKLSHEIGPRVRGSEAETEAVNWVADQFRGYGLETEVEAFEVTQARFADITPSRKTDEFASWQFSHSANGPLTTVSGDVVDIAGQTTGLAERTDLAGKMVLADWNTVAATRNATLKDLRLAGVAGVIFTKVAGQSAPEGLPSVGNLAAEEAGMVVLGSAVNQGKRMRTLLADGPLSIEATTKISSTTSHNAIGVLPAASGNPDAPIIYLGAHIDSVPGSPGASDNGSGVSILVEIARIMSEHKYDAEIRFGVWGAEEIGYKGSNYHVKTVMTAAEQARTLGAWNMDMAGTSYEGNPGQPFSFWALTADTNRPPLEPHESPVLDFSNQVSLIAEQGNLPIGTVSRSDHQPFHDVGIKAAVFSWMFYAGGTNIVLEPAYHQTTDTLEFVSAERMAHAARILGGGAFRAAMNQAKLDVVDADDAVVANARVAMSCEGDEGWRDGGSTDADGKLTVFTPNTSCDFVALAADGSRAFVADTALAAGGAAVAMQMQKPGAPVFALEAGQAPSATGWYLSAPVTVAADASNNFGDELTVEQSIDGDNWTPAADGTTFAEDGRYELFVRATDAQGNVVPSSVPVNLDATAPSLAVLADAAKRGAVSGTALDATSGVAAVQYRIGNGAWTDLKLEQPEADNGPQARSMAPQVVEAAKFAAQLDLGKEATTVEFRAMDTAGNASKVGSVKIAAGAPTGSLSNTGAESVTMFAIAAAALVLLGGGAMLMVRRNRAQRVNEDA